ncbi:hypothetical protein [Shimazuella kribbensis]|uniref:hypothetical protein n=1 Tax=Shimazuella kribbensis TaxID=139808 RepID=UPI0004006637|nr:hypothetical protein [Shimazuella kribbensis]
MLQNKIKTKDESFIQKEWNEYKNHVSWWEAEQPLSPLPAELQILLIKNDPSFVDELMKFAILVESSYVWNDKTKRYDYAQPSVVLKRDRSWLWTLYLLDHPLAKEGLKKLLKYYTYQEFQTFTANTGVYIGYYNYYGGRNGSYHVLNTNYMRYVKAIYKLAEKRQDHEIWTLLAHRFDTQRDYNNSITRPQKNTNSKNRWQYEYGSTPKTRRYLTRRSWRHLNKIGEQDSSVYVEITTDLLLQYNTSHTKQIRVSHPKTNHTHYIKSYIQNWLYNHILYHHSKRFTYGSSTWKASDNAYFDDASDIREEAFPSLWDQHPDKLLQLLMEAEASPVVHFAGRALRLGNPVFVAKISNKIIDQLLQSNEPYRQEFAVREVLHRLDKTNPDLERWIKLSTHPNEKIRSLANEFLQTHSTHWSKETKIQLVLKCLEKINESPTAAYLEEWYSLFKNELQPILREIVTISMLKELLHHENTTVQRFIALLFSMIQRHQHPYVADDLLPFLEHRAEIIRETARNVLHKDYMVLSCTPDFLARWCAIPFEDNQVFLTPFFADRMHWLMPMLTPFLDELWSRMMNPDLPESSRVFIQNDLLGTLFLSGLVDTPLDQILTLLDHHDTDFQTLGARIFAAKQPTVDQFTMDQLQNLAHNQIALCRSQARDMIIQVKEQITDQWLVNFVETEWDDTRDWGFAYMRSMSVDQFTPTLIYGLIDSARQDVQAFGMEMVDIHFNDLDITELLLRSSESTDLYVQEYALSLAEKIDWDADKVVRLELFFRTILFKVHQARKAKQMVLNLLIRLGKTDRQMAEKIIPILADLATIGGKRDFERILFTLTQLQSLYPNLETPLQLR